MGATPTELTELRTMRGAFAPSPSETFHSWMVRLAYSKRVPLTALFLRLGVSRKTPPPPGAIAPLARPHRRAWAAFVAQDGIGDTVIPLSAFDVLFIGGSTEFKLSNRARRLTIKAHNRGKWVHMDRVTSKRRFDALSWGVDSVDGTYLAFGPTVNLPRLLYWFPTEDAA